MDDMKKKPGSPSLEITREELGNIAYMCYILNRTEMTRWYHQWRTILERKANEGWTVDGLELRGLVRQKLELVYGIAPKESRVAVRKFPLVNMGVEPWQVLTDDAVNELTKQIFRSFVGLTPDIKHNLCFLQAEDDNKDGQDSQGDCRGSYDIDTSYADDTDNGGFYFT